MQIGEHRIQDATLHGLEAVPYIGKGPRGNNGQRVVQVAGTRCFVQWDDIYDRHEPAPITDFLNRTCNVRKPVAMFIWQPPLDELFIAWACVHQLWR